jgi:hypothetical protein
MYRQNRVELGAAEFTFAMPAEVAADLEVYALGARATVEKLAADLVMEHLREWQLIDSRERHEVA